MVDAVEHVGDKWVIERLRQIVNRRDGHKPAEPLDPESRRMLEENAVENGGQLVAVFEARGDGRKARIILQMRCVDRVGKQRPELRYLRHHKDPAIGGPEGLAGRDARVRGTRCTADDMIGVEIPIGRIAGLMDRRIEERYVVIAALACGLGVEQPCERRRGEHRSGYEVDHAQAKARRRGVGFARDRHEPGFGLHQIIIAGPRRAWAGAAIGAGVDADDGGIDLAQCGVIEAELGGEVTTRVVCDSMRRGGEAAQDFLPRAGPRVERDRFLVEVESLVKQAVVVAKVERPRHPRRVAAALAIFGGGFDLDDFGPELGKEHGAIGTGTILFGRQDAIAGEGEGHAKSSSFPRRRESNARSSTSGVGFPPARE